MWPVRAVTFASSSAFSASKPISSNTFTSSLQLILPLESVSNLLKHSVIDVSSVMMPGGSCVDEQRRHGFNLQIL